MDGGKQASRQAGRTKTRARETRSNQASRASQASRQAGRRSIQKMLHSLKHQYNLPHSSIPLLRFAYAFTPYPALARTHSSLYIRIIINARSPSPASIISGQPSSRLILCPSVIIITDSERTSRSSERGGGRRHEAALQPSKDSAAFTPRQRCLFKRILFVVRRGTRTVMSCTQEGRRANGEHCKKNL